MKYCRRCGRMMPDEARFCPGCGFSALPQSEESFFSYSALRRKNRQKKIILIVVSCLCLLTASGTGLFFLLRHDNNDPYAQNIAMAEKYLLEEDYERAEEYYAKASQIEPKKSEPYEKLYEIYTATDQEEKAEEVEKKASEELSDKHQQAFEEKKEEIKDTYQPVNAYTVLADLPDQEMTPININSEIWLVKENGEFAFLNKEGKKVSDYTTEDVHLRLNRQKPEEKRIMTACIATSSNLVADRNQWPNKHGGPSGCVVQEQEGPVLEYILDEQQKRTLSEASAKSDSNAGQKAPEITEPYFLRQEKDGVQNYYVFNPEQDTLYGPYENSETAGFGVLISQKEELSFASSETGQFAQLLYGPFWSKDKEQKDHPVILHRSDGKTKLTGFDKAQVVDAQSIAGFNKDRFTLYDASLQPVYTGFFEAGGTPIEQIAPVKIRGKWKLVKLGELTKDRSQLSRMAEDPASEDTKPEDESSRKEQPSEQNGNTS